MILLLAVLVSFINHRVRLGQESALFVPLGEMVQVGAHSLSVYKEGAGPANLVFMAGSGTASPILDFRSLYTQLSDDYGITVVERLGYGFSDVAAEPRDVDTVLEQTRAALAVADVHPPFVLFPHSMAVLEALRWAHLYPEEIAAIIGLDAAVPSAYEDGNVPGGIMLELAWFGARTGITRFIPGLVDDSAAIKAGSLTEHEKEIYRAVFYRRTETRPMVNELRSVEENALLVDDLPSPQVPMLFFTSNGEGTAHDAHEWQQHQTDFLSRVDNGQQVTLDSGHYVHDYDYLLIADRSRGFLVELGIGGD